MENKYLKKHFKNLGVDLKDSDIVFVSEKMDADVVYNISEEIFAETNDKKFITSFIVASLLVPSILFLIFYNSFKIVPMDVLGKSFSVGEYSFVLKSNKVSIGDLNKGKKVLISEEDQKSMVYSKYAIAEVLKASDFEILVTINGIQKSIKIEQIDYVLR